MNITALLGAAFLLLAAFLAVREHHWLAQAQFAEGTVVEMVPTRGSKGTTYKPRIRYTTMDGQQREFVRSYSSSPAGFVVGEKVALAVDPQSGEARIATFGARFGFPLVLGAIGLALAVVALGFVFGRDYVPRIYLPEAR